MLGSSLEGHGFDSCSREAPRQEKKLGGAIFCSAGQRVANPHLLLLLVRFLLLGSLHQSASTQMFGIDCPLACSKVLKLTMVKDIPFVNNSCKIAMLSNVTVLYFQFRFREPIFWSDYLKICKSFLTKLYFM